MKLLPDYVRDLHQLVIMMLLTMIHHDFTSEDYDLIIIMPVLLGDELSDPINDDGER